jgi:NADPH:quinone reductase-like Zn-dependent oxidoreductase
MKAIVYTKYGTPDVLQLAEVEKPIPKDNEVLVKVHAASINSWDWDLLRGTPFVNRLMCGVLKPKRITILGCDIAGRIEAVGKKVTQFQPGDEVFGDLSRSRWGGFAEYVCARENALALKPTSMNFKQAAAIPQAALLALQGLIQGHIQQGQIKAGQKILINGASGGVGSFAVPMAKLLGVEVTGVCSTKKTDFVFLLGADHVIDYKQQDFTKNGKCYDLILDVQGYHSIFDYKRALSPRGIYVMVGGCTTLVNQIMLLGPFISITGGKKMGLLLHKANKGLDHMIELFEAGKVAPYIDKCFPLTESAEAMRYFGEGHAKGKVVITMEHD